MKQDNWQTGLRRSAAVQIAAALADRAERDQAAAKAYANWAVNWAGLVVDAIAKQEQYEAGVQAAEDQAAKLAEASGGTAVEPH